MGSWGGGCQLSSGGAIPVSSFIVNSSCFIVGVPWCWKSERLCPLGTLCAGEVEVLVYLPFLLVLKAGTLCSLLLIVAVWRAGSSKLGFVKLFHSCRLNSGM